VTWIAMRALSRNEASVRYARAGHRSRASHDAGVNDLIVQRMTTRAGGNAHVLYGGAPTSQSPVNYAETG
jgi:hypothetical protein